VQYVDDMLIIMQANVQQLLFLKDFYKDLVHATGLRVNYLNFNFIYINVSDDRVHFITSALQCQRVLCLLPMQVYFLVLLNQEWIFYSSRSNCLEKATFLCHVFKLQ
jgi:hypothetical protein